jgi:uncharacterized protein YchJ
MPSPSKPAACPCGGGAFATCCGPYLAGDAIAESAELLMRSRYSAYTLRDENYLRVRASPMPPAVTSTPPAGTAASMASSSSSHRRQLRRAGATCSDSMKCRRMWQN